VLLTNTCTYCGYTVAVRILRQWALPRLKRLAASHREGSPSIPRPFHMRAGMNKVTMGQVICQYFCFLCQYLRVHFHLNTYVNRRTMGRSLANFKHSNVLLDIRHGTGKCFCVFLVFKHLSVSLSFAANRCRDGLLKRISWRQKAGLETTGSLNFGVRTL